MLIKSMKFYGAGRKAKTKLDLTAWRHLETLAGKRVALQKRGRGFEPTPRIVQTGQKGVTKHASFTRTLRDI